MPWKLLVVPSLVALTFLFSLGFTATFEAGAAMDSPWGRIGCGAGALLSLGLLVRRLVRSVEEDWREAARR